MGTYVHVSMSKCSGDGNPHRIQKLQLCWGSNFGLQIKDPDGRPFETGKKKKKKITASHTTNKPRGAGNYHKNKATLAPPMLKPSSPEDTNYWVSENLS